jgi:uncharacterized protein
MPLRLSILAMLLLALPCAAAEESPAYEEWLTFKKELELQAGGPTGMYAIQDMVEVNPGETARLPGTNASVEYKDGKATISGPSIQTTDLLKQKDRQMPLPNGLTVRVSFLGEKALKVWLYNPKLTAQRKYKGLSFFPYDAKGVITGTFTANANPVAVNYLDSRDYASTMYVVGTLQVVIDGKKQDLKAFSYKKTWDEIDYLLLLLKDGTSGKTTYGGGRVVEIRVPKGAPPRTVTANLNTAYSFLCAHSEFYNCPLVLTNQVDADLTFGEKYPPL